MNILKELGKSKITSTVNENKFCEDRVYPCDDRDMFSIIEDPIKMALTVTEKEPSVPPPAQLSYHEFLKKRVGELKMESPHMTGKERLARVQEEWRSKKLI